MTAGCLGCGGGIDHDPAQHTYRFYCGPECAATALAKRVGYTRTTPNTGGTSIMAKKSTTKAKAAKAPKALNEYTREKLAVQDQLPIGSHRVYTGDVKPFAGKKVTITAHEARGGIHIELDGKTKIVSPFALGIPRPGEGKAKPKGKGTKATKASRSKPAKKSAESATPAPQTPAPPAPAAPPAQAKGKGKAVAKKAA